MLARFANEHEFCKSIMHPMQHKLPNILNHIHEILNKLLILPGIQPADKYIPSDVIKPPHHNE